MFFKQGGLAFVFMPLDKKNSRKVKIPDKIMNSYLNIEYIDKEDCSYQGEALNVPTAFLGPIEQNNLKNLNVKKRKSKNIPPHAILSRR